MAWHDPTCSVCTFQCLLHVSSTFNTTSSSFLNYFWQIFDLMPTSQCDFKSSKLSNLFQRFDICGHRVPKPLVRSDYVLLLVLVLLFTGGPRNPSWTTITTNQTLSCASESVYYLRLISYAHWQISWVLLLPGALILVSATGISVSGSQLLLQCHDIH